MAITIAGSGIVEANLADNAVTLAKMASGTDGEILTYDASGNPTSVSVGTDGQVLTSTGAGSPPAFEAAAGGGLYASVAIICDQKSAGTKGGSFTSGNWRTRDLNTEISDADGIVTIAGTNDSFTLGAGTYTIEWSSPGYKVHVHKARLCNTTDSTYSYGSTAYNDNGTDVQTVALGSTVVTISGSKVFEIQSRCYVTKNTNGWGEAVAGLEVEKYTVVKILKHS